MWELIPVNKVHLNGACKKSTDKLKARGHFEEKDLSGVERERERESPPLPSS